MICQHEILSILSAEIPGFSEGRFPTQTALRPYSAVSQFTHFTREAVNHNRRKTARKCFLLAERLYKEGDPMVKQLIDNYFIYSFTSYLASPHSDEVRHLIPPDLYKVYIKEMINNHC